MKIKNSQFPQAILKKMFFGIAAWRFLHQGGREFFFVLLKFVKINLSARGISVRQEAIPNKQYFFLASGVVNLWVDLSCQLSAF